MLFNSFLFLKFFLIFYPLYLLTRNHLKWQNRLLLAASYLFYAAWDWRFLFLLFFTTFLDFILAQKIYESESPRKRKTLLIISIVCNLGVLGFFKYFNFFTESLSGLFAHWGLAVPLPLVRVALPIGISFYTFQSMSYTIDVYRRELVPPKSFLDFGVFVTYFPHLVAGPILRATHILPQVLNPRKIRIDQVYVDRVPGQPLAPALREFITFLLSAPGQQAITKDGGYFALPVDLAKRIGESLA